MAEDNSNTSHTPEPRKSKSNRFKVILKSVLKAVIAIWHSYKMLSKVIEFFNELFG